MPMDICIGIIGDFHPEFHSHRATNAAIQHAAAGLNINCGVRWIPTTAFLSENTAELLHDIDGLWASPGSPYASFDGMLSGIRIARERLWPFVAT